MFKFGESELKLALFCIAGIILNLLGEAIVENFYLSMYLDTMGTVFIAALCGYLPGIAVGFSTNLLGSLINDKEIYYNPVNVLLAVITAFLAGRGYYEKFSRVLLTIPATVLLTTLIGTTISELLTYSLSIKFDWISIARLFEHLL
ncbi:MAG: hypothetical protein J5497_07545, partial [Selenomonadaceae bacterium]|nr:hypothetical protein [Selenomonadaceae bacterium]